ncbi:hypothetical protein FKW77_000430 [Venturia effusa]|uniref:Uncharacterized protein n=1 Tax=Venturia effusa TaxID=50376 RepID=A0A517LN76_9PEZI|nr:hypothetical protein FKW77_000430 [Venturia effusa]
MALQKIPFSLYHDFASPCPKSETQYAISTICLLVTDILGAKHGMGHFETEFMTVQALRRISGGLDKDLVAHHMRPFAVLKVKGMKKLSWVRFNHDCMAPSLPKLKLEALRIWASSSHEVVI